VLTIKPRFVVDNQTGMAIEVKQKGSPDLDADPYYGGDRRCSCTLDPNQRQALSNEMMKISIRQNHILFSLEFHHLS
jgi:hypothetical protein